SLAACSPLQAGIQADARLEHLGDRAALLGLLGDLLELLLLGAGHPGPEGQCDGGDLEAVADLVQADLGAGVDALGGPPGRAEQLFRVGAGLVLEAGVEAVGVVLQGAALGAQVPFAFLQVALPDGRCVLLHGDSSTGGDPVESAQAPPEFAVQGSCRPPPAL